LTLVNAAAGWARFDRPSATGEAAMTLHFHNAMRWVIVALALALIVLLARGVEGQEEPRGRLDIGAGRAAFDISCKSCHSLKAGVIVTGPSLAGVFGRRAGADPTFEYSDQLRNSKITWTDATLDPYLSDPANLGTQVNMIIHGIKDTKMRADLIAFLKYEAK
jgi:cytochrome c